MSAVSKIEWTDRTWNPVRGCSLVSAGCTNCYAMRQAHRFSGPGQPYQALTKMTSHGPVWTGTVAMVKPALEEPLHWKKPARVFVNSMSDLFHEHVTDEFIDQVFAVMCRAREHTFQILTKRASRMQLYLSHPERRERVFQAGQDLPLCARASLPPWPLPNVWTGVSVENQEMADVRILYLLETPAAVRWLSCEPLLGLVDLRQWLGGIDIVRAKGTTGPVTSRTRRGIDWVVCGGESGPSSRPMYPNWARSLRDQCAAPGVPFFFKQWGDWRTPIAEDGVPPGACDGVLYRVGKKAAGRLLDGVTHDEYPS